MSTLTVNALLTAEDYLALADDGRHKELVRGRLVEMNMPGFEHGAVCGNVYFVLRSYVSKRDLGRVVCNDTGIVTERDPDTVRGADVAYYSYDRVPRRRRPKGYAGAAPELVVEVLSPEDRWTRVLRKVSEYLESGVDVVCIVSAADRKVFVYRPDSAVRELGETDELTLPTLLPGLRIPVKRFFE
jgi:Uma2 family endonuclease